MEGGPEPGSTGRAAGTEGRTPATLREFLAPPRARLRIAGWVIAITGTAALAAIFTPLRDDVSTIAIGFGFLAVVVASASVGGLGPGTAASVGGFLVYNYLFLPPYETFRIGRAEYVVVLFVFLGIALLITLIVARARDRAEAAETRAAELRALQGLSSDLVRLGPGPETYRVVLGRVVELFGVDGAALFVADTDRPDGLAELVTVGEAGGLDPGHDRSEAAHASERLPLLVGTRNLGVIVLRGERPPLGPGESRILRSFCDQLALILERDRLQRSATEAEVYRRGESMRRALLAAVSHDLRSPLAAIKASVTDLLDPEVERPDEDERDVLRTIDRESDRLNALIADLLDMSRIEAGTLRARQEPVDLLDLLTRCLAIVGQEHPTAAGRISMSAEETRALGDPTLVERVAVNLLANAARASDGGPIELRATRVADRVVVRVVDHGEGMGPNAREQLFYPFYRLDERNPRLGTGLGLAICKGYVEAMRGDIWVEDTPGGGATFAFALLPVEDRT